MLASNYPVNFPVPFASSAGAGYIRPIPTASQIGITAGAASLTDGFPPLNFLPVTSGGVPPFGQDMNGILYEITANIQWEQAGGQPVYNSAFSTAIGGYPNGAVLQSDDGTGFWRSTVDNNTTNPETGGANWVPHFFYGEAIVPLTSADVTLTLAQYAKPIIVLTGTITANLNLILPTILNKWIVQNNTSGSFTVTAKPASGTGVVVPQGGAVFVYGDGTNIYSAGITQAAADARYLKQSGGTMTGAIVLAGNPANPLEAAPKQYVDSRSPSVVKQTVLGGPVDTNGLPTFLPATSGSLSLTTQNVSSGAPLVASVAAGINSTGSIDVVGSTSSNITWGGLTASTTLYLYGTISGGIITPGFTSLPPIYQLGGTPSVTVGQFTFNIQQMTGYMGNGTTAPQANIVFFGECVTSGSEVTSSIAYAYQGRAFLRQSSLGLATRYALSHNIGVNYYTVDSYLECTTNDKSYVVGDRWNIVSGDTSANGRSTWTTQEGRNQLSATTGSAAIGFTENKTTGSAGALTVGSWAYVAFVQRAF